MARKRENEIQSQNNDVQKEQNRMSYVDAKDSLEASVTQWDKNSVIGILGQQITADYVINGVKMTGACDAIRKAIASSDPPQKYAAMAPLFAKVLLYSQLRNERTANNGEPGEMEKLLGTGNSIQENIENITQEMVNDPVFQNLVLKKMGSVEGRTVGLQRGKFQDLIASGGCVSFWQEYKQNKKEMGSKEQYASTIENQMENEKQKDAPHL